MTPFGRRIVSAMLNASSTTVVCNVVDIDQPTIRRLKTSSTTARYRKPSPRRNVRDISHPQHIRCIRGKRPVDQIGRLPSAVAHRCDHKLAAADADNARVAHQPRDTVLADVNALRRKLRMNPWRAIGSARHRVDRAHRLWSVRRSFAPAGTARASSTHSSRWTKCPAHGTWWQSEIRPGARSRI